MVDLCGVLDAAVDQGVDALVDVGALLAGRPLREVALELTRRQARPVVFFDNSAHQPGWVLLNDRGLQWPLAASPNPEREAFVVFDQARCRGADLKLKPDAVAMITVSADLCKDALIQVCGVNVGLLLAACLVLLGVAWRGGWRGGDDGTKNRLVSITTHSTLG